MNDREKSLIEECKQGDIESFELLIKDHQQMAFNIAYRMLGNIEDARDASQDAFIKIFKNIKTFKGNSSFSTWMYRIVSNTCLDELRKKKKHHNYSYDNPIKTEDGEMSRNIPMVENTPEEIINMKESQKLIQNALNKLSDQNKAVIVLRDIKGFSYEQISEILNCPEGTVKSRISRARVALKTILVKDMELFNNGYVKI